PFALPRGARDLRGTEDEDVTSSCCIGEEDVFVRRDRQEAGPLEISREDIDAKSFRNGGERARWWLLATRAVACRPRGERRRQLRRLAVRDLRRQTGRQH